MSDVLHVLPINDLVEHQHATGSSCPCNPTSEMIVREDSTTAWLLIHHSADGRELSE